MIVFKPTSLKEKNEKERAASEEKNAQERAAAQLKAAIETLENALCEMDEANAERLAAIEDALCEIDIGDVGGNV